MGVGAKYRSGITAVAIPLSGSFQPHLSKNTVLCAEFGRTMRHFLSTERRTSISGERESIDAQVENGGTAWCIRGTTNDLVYWSIHAWRFRGKWKDLNTSRVRSQRASTLNWSARAGDRVPPMGTEQEVAWLTVSGRTYHASVCSGGSWPWHVSLALFYCIGQRQLWTSENTLHLFSGIRIKTRRWEAF